MTTLELWIKRHNRRLMLGLFLQRAGEWLAVWLFLFGAAVLAAKLFLPEYWPGVLWLGLFVIPILLLAGRSAVHAQYSRDEAVALLDRQLKGGGLIMALSESDDPAWHGRLPQTPELWKRKLPKLRPVRFFRLIGWPMAFALGALLIPTRNPHPSSGFSPSVGKHATSQLDNMLGLLEASHVVPPEEAAEIKEVIEQLAKETETAPLTSERWETVDALRKSMGERLEANETELAGAARKVSKLLEANGGDLEKLLPESEADLEKVADLVKSLSDSGALSGLSEGLPPGFENLLRQGATELAENPQLRNQVLGQVQTMLQSRSQDLQNVHSQFDRVFADTMRDPTTQEASATAPENREATSVASGDIKWGDDQKANQRKFKQIVLPPGFLDDPNQKIAGISPGTRTPMSAKPSENLTDKVPSEFGGGGGEVRSRELRPRHRGVIKNYFGQDTTPENKEKGS